MNRIVFIVTFIFAAGIISFSYFTDNILSDERDELATLIEKELKETNDSNRIKKVFLDFEFGMTKKEAADHYHELKKWGEIKDDSYIITTEDESYKCGIDIRFDHNNELYKISLFADPVETPNSLLAHLGKSESAISIALSDLTSKIGWKYRGRSVSVPNPYFEDVKNQYYVKNNLKIEGHPNVNCLAVVSYVDLEREIEMEEHEAAIEKEEKKKQRAKMHEAL